MYTKWHRFDPKRKFEVQLRWNREEITRWIMQYIYIYTYCIFYRNVLKTCFSINSMRSSDAYMRRQTKPSVVPIMDCRLLCVRLLSEQMLVYCQSEASEQISVKFDLRFLHFHTRKYIWNVVCKMTAVLSRRPRCVKWSVACSTASSVLRQVI